jgi:predicted N-acetyltransferase YhbS
MTTTPIRPATPADAESIARLINDAFNPERFYIDGDRTNPDKVRALMDKGKFLLVFDHTTLAGCVYAELRGERGYFGLLAVDPTRQGSGIGARLIAAAEQECRSAGCRFMDLSLVNLRTWLPPYYRRFGYVETGTLPFPADQHPPKVPIHLIQMSKPL